MTRKKNVAALVVAAGSGTRMGGDVPKQFIEIEGTSILQLTLQKFQRAAQVNFIYVVTNPNCADQYSDIIKKDWGIEKLSAVVAGGVERHDSVWAGLQAIDNSVDIVLIHDGVRPFVSESIIDASISAAQSFGAALVGVTPKDTVKRIRDDCVSDTLDRRELFLAQTPQAFQKKIILAAYEHAFLKGEFSTDDSALVENIGRKVVVVPGDRRNIKITTPEDIYVARAFMEMDK